MLARTAIAATAGATGLLAYNKLSGDNILAASRPNTMAMSAPAVQQSQTLSYYLKCMVAGALSCGLTHLAVTPLDVIKCRMQANPTVFPDFKFTLNAVAKEGALFLGWFPTLVGYSVQGLCKFGFYEIFKHYYSSLLSPENAIAYRTFIYLAASASAEVIADVALCPFECVKVRVQTAAPGSGISPHFATTFQSVLRNEGAAGFFAGLKPLWGRQVPYTMVKFATFERTVEAMYKYIFTKGKANYSDATNLSITFASGYIAGVFCALVSQPADTLVSLMNKDPTANMNDLIKQNGIRGLYKGLGVRVMMVGTLTGLQWWIYDGFKTLVGINTPPPPKQD